MIKIIPDKNKNLYLYKDKKVIKVIYRSGVVYDCLGKKTEFKGTRVFYRKPKPFKSSQPYKKYQKPSKSSQPYRKYQENFLKIENDEKADKILDKLFKKIK